jgi:alkylation response protein AidB-like acyl-CoA dehydrogenase
LDNIIAHDTRLECAAVVELLGRARNLLPSIRQHAARGEAERRIAQEVTDAIAKAGLFKLMTPRRYGGYESSAKALLDLCAIVAEADGATAWVVTLINISCWIASLFPVRAQDEIFGADPNAKVSSVLSPTATCRKIEGGFVVSGKWYYNSGSWWADWAALGFPIVNERGEVVDQGLALVPRASLTIEDTWIVAGMAGSASHCLVAQEVFVPDHRVMSVPQALEGDYPTERKPDEPLYRAAFAPLLALVLVGPQLGLGRAALELVKSKAAMRPISYTYFNSQAQSTGFQLQLAQAALLIDTAHLHAYRAAADIDAAALAGTYPDKLLRARVRADTALVAEKICQAIDILLSAHGAAAFADASPLQRIWRDSAMAARHAFVLPQVGYEIYGRALLGLAEPITPFA